MAQSEIKIQCPNCNEMFLHSQAVWSVFEKHTLIVPCPECGHNCKRKEVDNEENRTYSSEK